MAGSHDATYIIVMTVRCGPDIMDSLMSHLQLHDSFIIVCVYCSPQALSKGDSPCIFCSKLQFAFPEKL